jgi:hypothetical protein
MLRRLAMLAVFAAGAVAVQTKVTSKTQATEKRLNAAVAQLSTSNANLTTLIGVLEGIATTSNGLSNGTINGHTDNAGLTDGTINGTSGGQSAGTAHTHGPGSYAVTNGQHDHGGSATNGTLAVTNGTHTHNLPSTL